MRVLLSVPRTHPFGKDYVSILAHSLIERGHDVEALQFAQMPQADFLEVETAWVSRSIDRYIDDNLVDGSHVWFTTYGRWMFNWVLYHRWRRITRTKLERDDYDVVVSAFATSAPGALGAADADVPSVILTTGPAALKYDPDYMGLDKTPHFGSIPWTLKVQYPFLRSVHRMNERAFTGVDEIVAVSEFDASVTEATFGRRPRVIYLPVRLEDFEVADHAPEHITLVNPRDRHKGLETFLEIADRFREESFLIVGQLYDPSKESAIEARDNVEYVGWTDEMTAIYRTTKLLLIPSTYQEGGNRVIAEAFVNGIPVVGSDIGGIPDYIGDGGVIVEEFHDVDAWVEALEGVLSDPEQYEALSAAAYRRRERFDIEARIDEFESVLAGLTDR